MNSLKACLGIALLLSGTAFAYHGEDKNPFEIESYGILLADQEITKQAHDEFGNSKFHGDKVQFGEAHIGLRYHYYCSGCCEEYMIGGGYTYTRLRWNQNPFFRQRNYNTATLDLGARLGCICDWDIDNFVRTQLDTESPNTHYLFWDIMSWARLKHRPNLGINVGALIFTGMKVNRLYPIFGIDWKPTDFLEVNLVYPLKMNITYLFCNGLSLSFGGRLIYSRHRVREQDKYEDFRRDGLDGSHAIQYFGPPEPIPTVDNFPPDGFSEFLNPRSFARAVWEYRAYGIEGAIGYLCTDILAVKIFGGWSFDNHLTIGAHGFNHKQTYKLKATPYIGAEFMLRF